MRIETIKTGFIEIPNRITINIFANGCKLNCPNCSNPHLQSFDGGVAVDITELLKRLNRHRPLSNIVCWLGGDATFHETDFKEFNKVLKSNGYIIVTYTGRYKEDIEELIDDVDILIDSPWQGKMITEDDTNQRIFIRDDIDSWKQITYKELQKLTKENKIC